MLLLTIVGEEVYNEETEEFSTVGDIVLELEHSLVSLSKWESKWQIPFLGSQEKTNEQLLDYVRCMILTPGAPENAVDLMSQKNIDDVQDYIQSPQTATTFYDDGRPQSRPRETITAELVYYWMASFQLPIEVENWHLNRLFALIRIASIKNQDPKKSRMSKAEIAARNRDLNQQRRAKLNTTG